MTETQPAASTRTQPAAAEHALAVGVAFWTASDGIATGLQAQASVLGHRPVKFMCQEPIPPGLDVVMASGPFGSLAPLGRGLQALPARERPALAFFLSEQLPNPALPEWWRRGVGGLRSRFDRWAHVPAADGAWRARPGWGRLLRLGARYRYYGDLFWLRDAGLLSALAVWSHWTAAFLRARGFDPVVPGRARNPDMGADLGLERDIPVLWLGKPGSGRRRRLLARLRRELAARGVPLMVIDGEENPYVFGQARTRLLNRAKIMLNLLRSPWDDNSLRYTLAAHNKVLIVTETTLPHTDYQPGEHLVAAPVDQLAGTICRLLADDAERARIVNNAHRLVERGEPGAGLRPVLARALAVHPPQRAR